MTARFVGGRFVLGGLLGAGGTASVYEAATLAGDPVAIKILHPALSGTTAMREAFFEEVRAARAVGHVGVARMYDSGVDAGEPPTAWIAMELVRGRTLSRVVAERGALALTDADAVARGLLAALAAAHRAGVVHRDVTPTNVMIDPDALGRPAALQASLRLLDFGLADIPGRPTAGADALLSGLGPVDGVVASVPYASPEHLRGDAVTESADVYQAAGTIFFALTARAPFVGERSEVVRAHLHAPAVRVSAVRDGVSPDIDRWLATALGKDPRARFPDAAVMLAAMPDARATGVQGAVPRVGAPESPEPTRLLPVAATSAPAAAGIPRGRASGPGASGWLVATVGGLAIAAILASAAGAGAGGSAPGPDAGPAVSASAPPTPTATPSASGEGSAPLQAVPEIEGLSLADAVAQLTSRGFVVGTVAHVDAPRAADTVLSSDPAPGATVRAGRDVVLRVASGNNLVPGVAGRRPDEAVMLLAEAGFSASTRTVLAAPAGAAAGTEPAEGTSLPLGAAVVLLVGADAPPPTPTPPPATPGPPATPAPTLTPGAGGTR